MADTADSSGDTGTEPVAAEPEPVAAEPVAAEPEPVAAAPDPAPSEPREKVTASKDEPGGGSSEPSKERPVDDKTKTATGDKPASGDESGVKDETRSTAEPSPEPAEADNGSTMGIAGSPSRDTPEPARETPTPTEEMSDDPAAGDDATGVTASADGKGDGTKTKPGGVLDDQSATEEGVEQPKADLGGSESPVMPSKQAESDATRSSKDDTVQKPASVGSTDKSSNAGDEPARDGYAAAEVGALPDGPVGTGSDDVVAASSLGDDSTVTEPATVPSADPMDRTGAGERIAEQLATDPSIAGDPIDVETGLPFTPHDDDARFEEAAPSDANGEFTPGDLADALKGEREDVFSGIVEPPTEFGIEPEQLDAGAIGAVDPRESISTDSAGILADPHISAEPEPPPESEPEPEPEPTPEPDDSDDDIGGSGADQENTDGGGGPKPPSAKQTVGQVWNKIAGFFGSDGESADDKEDNIEDGGGGVRGTPTPDADPDPDHIPDGLDMVLGGASEPEETDVMGSLIQHQEPGDAAVDADQARALLNKAANPLDPFIEPAEDDGDVPDGLYVPGGGVEETDPFDSLIQPSGPDDPLGDPSAVSDAEADIAGSHGSVADDDPSAGLDEV